MPRGTDLLALEANVAREAILRPVRELARLVARSHVVAAATRGLLTGALHAQRALVQGFHRLRRHVCDPHAPQAGMAPPSEWTLQLTAGSVKSG